MAPLARELRKDLANKVTAARRLAEEGARKVIEALAVHNIAPWDTMSPADKKLRNRLRAHGRQLGDRGDQRGAQSVDRLVSEVAYEHWHGMLFARFLAENDLLMLPGTNTAITLDEVEEIAREEKRDWLVVVSEYAEKMLPQIFRPGDPVLEIVLPRETRNELEKIVRGLDTEVFAAVDSLGWVYQFWQADRKDEVNGNGNKIGADELPAVTQLFTEDYMVDFLLDNTLGAWHAGKALAQNPALAETARTEDELRNAVALPGCPWTYLRFVKRDGRWTPAAGTFDGWPKTARKLRCLDPCMGSGHFVVAMFERLVALLIAEDQMDPDAAVAAVIKDNLFGLEIDPRCTQIAAFNLALAAWRKVGHRRLPAMNLACSGLTPNARDEWSKVAGDSDRLQRGMARLYGFFNDAPVLGSLIDPRAVGGDLLQAEFHELRPLLEKALERESKDDVIREMAVTARGLSQAAEILSGQFTLVATNVPYLGRGKQVDTLQDYCERVHPQAKADLATCFVERCLNFCADGTSVCLVTPQNWLFLGSYLKMRAELLEHVQWDAIAKLGPHAFETIGGEVVNVCLLGLTRRKPASTHRFAGFEAAEEKDPAGKAEAIRSASPIILPQIGQTQNPDCRIVLVESAKSELLSGFASSFLGLGTGDYSRFGRCFWELPFATPEWEFQQGSVDAHVPFGGREYLVYWDKESGRVRGMSEAEREQIHNQDQSGQQAWGKTGICVSLNKVLPVTHYSGELFDKAVAVLIPKRSEHLLPLRAYAESDAFQSAVRALDQKTIVANGTLVKVPFDLAHWQSVADQKYPDGLPKPSSNDPTQWLFDGHPKGSDHPLQVAVARLLGYRWPRQTGSNFQDCAPLRADGLEKLADEDGIVCLSPTRGEASAEQRVREVLESAWGKDWNSATLERLLAQVGFAGKTLDDWLRNGFFEEHCGTFHSRPFIWHIWDGRRDGFNALVNYHRLAASEEGGRRTLDKLIYTHLGAWIEQQEAAQKDEVEGADGRLASAQHLKGQLEQIRKGEAPFDIFVRWKSLSEQPVGWKPDINDGIRLNIRPFMTARPLAAKAKNSCILRFSPGIGWEKDRGKDPERPRSEFPWFWKWDGSVGNFLGGSEFDGARWNDLHYSVSVKKAAALNKDAA